MPSRRPMIGPMTPGIELAERIEQAQILVIVHAHDIFADRTAQRHHAQPLRPFGGKGLDRIVDLQRPLTVPDQQAERFHAMFEQGMKYVRRARAVTEDRRAARASAPAGSMRQAPGRCARYPGQPSQARSG